MKMRIAALAALVVVMFAAPAAARGHTGYNDIVSFGHGVTVPAGQDVGDLVVMGGTADVHGHVHGDAVIFGGGLHIAPEGEVDGDTVSFGGGVDNESRARGAKTPETPMPAETMAPETPMPAETPETTMQNESTGPGAWPIIIILDALLTLVAFALFPLRTEHSLEQLHDQPLLSAALGFLSPLILATVAVVLAATVIGIPLIPVVVIAYFLAYLVGKAGIALFLGRRFLELAQVREPRPMIAVLLGLVILLLITGATPLWWFAIPVMACIGCISAGAAIVSFIRMRPRTGFGTPVTVAAGASQAFAPPVEPPSSGPPATQ